MKNNKKISIEFIELSKEDHIKDCKIDIQKYKLKLQNIEERKSLLLKEYYQIEKRIKSLNIKEHKYKSLIHNCKEVINKQS